MKLQLEKRGVLAVVEYQKKAQKAVLGDEKKRKLAVMRMAMIGCTKAELYEEAPDIRGVGLKRRY